MNPAQSDDDTSKSAHPCQLDQSIVSVVGSGWLGLALAQYLTAQSHLVRISTRSEEKYQTLSKAQYNTLKFNTLKYNIHKLNIESESSLDAGENQDFFKCDCVIIAIPPRETAAYQPLIDKLIKSKLKRIILISSTSVYRMTNTDIIESDLDALDPSSNMLAIERRFQACLPQTTIVRFGGLIGEGRHPVKWFAGKSHITASNAPVNFIHQADCVRIIQAIISQHIEGKVLNACADTHPTKAQLYGKLFQQAGIKAPEFIEQQPLMFKRINSDYLKQQLNYQFKFGNLEHIDFAELCSAAL
jgi:nucleoside-diphosphate-sugar epimerase